VFWSWMAVETKRGWNWFIRFCREHVIANACSVCDCIHDAVLGAVLKDMQEKSIIF
jgi:hypothetical protein